MYNDTIVSSGVDEYAVQRFAPLVADINEIYDGLRNVSNDELRSLVDGVKSEIEASEDKKTAINEKLATAYAVVKEIARRFTCGDIEVTASDDDRKIAEVYDFVIIKGDKAVYKNKWSVGGVPYRWEMVHYDEQLLGGILLHYGYAVEMATGEGKTLVATLPVFLNALSHEGVHMMTANEYLSKRDCEITRPIYLLCGISVDCIEFYNRHDVGRKAAYRSDITFGTASAFTFDYLFDHLATNPKECVQTEHNYAIIDELDSILIDDADNPHTVGGGHYYDNSQVYKDNIEYIRELLAADNAEELYTKDILRHKASFTDAGLEWLRKRIGNKSLFESNKTYQIEDFDLLSDEDKEAVYSVINLQNALSQLLLALTVYEKDVDYVVSPCRFGRNDLATIDIIDQNTGRLRKSSRWEHGLHTAVEVKEGVKPQLDFDGLGVISLKHFLKLYSKVAGMSGTIVTAADELNELYGLKCASLPTHEPQIRVDHPLRVFRTCEDKDAAIIEKINENKQSGRPTLVGCLTIKRSEALAGKLRDSGIECNRLDAKSVADEAMFISRAGVGNTLTVSTSIAGRGTDIKPSQDALAHGGLVVIGADLFNSVRVNQQLIGRTGRQGNPGSSVFFTSLEDSVLNYLSEEDKGRVEILVKDITTPELTSPEMADLFTNALENRERIAREARAETARKDDIIAPRRKLFYQKRNMVLHNPEYADTIVDEIIKSMGLSEKDIEKTKRTNYAVFTLLLERTKSINPEFDRLLVPFSCQGETFVLTFNVKSTKYDISMFMLEFKRQVILLNYDKYWQQFVLHILGDLDENEIDKLDEDFEVMMKNINDRIGSVISGSKIIFKPVKNDIVSHTMPTPKQNSKRKTVMSADALCPCASGKKYSECHGRGIRYKKKRRR